MHLLGIRSQVGLALLLGLSSCVSTGKLRDGDTAFRLGKYQIAAQMLSEEYADNRNPATRSAQAFRIGQSYDAMNRPRQAADWFGKAYADGYGPDALYAQAQQQKKLEDYQAAIASLAAVHARRSRPAGGDPARNGRAGAHPEPAQCSGLF
jgi:tetratricopeptide (TPR) repeat protein